MGIWQALRRIRFRGTGPAILALLLAGCAALEPEKPAPAAAAAVSGESETAPPATAEVELLPHEKDLKVARMQFNRREFDSAEFFLRKVLIQAPEEPLALKLLPRSYFFRGDIPRALAAFQRLHAVFPKDPDPFIGGGWCHLILKRYTESLKAFAKAESLLGGPTPETLKGRALVYWRQKRREKALAEFQKLFQPEQMDSVLNYLNALDESVYFDLSPADPGAPSLFAFPPQQPRFPGALWSLGEATEAELDAAWASYDRQSYGKARQAFADERFAGSLDARNGLAWSYLKDKQIREAETEFKAILAEYPNFIGAVRGIRKVDALKMKKAGFGQYYLDLNKIQIAERNFRDLAHEFPQWAHPLVRLGEIETRKGNPQVALKHFHKALDLEPDNADALRGLEAVHKQVEPELYAGDLALKNGDYKQAARIFYDYIERQNKQDALTSSLAHAYQGLGWSQFKKGQYALAIEKFERSGRHAYFRKDAAKGLGFSYYMLGKFDASADYLLTAKPQRADGEAGDITYRLDWSILKGRHPKSAERYFEKELTRDPLRSSLYMGMGWVQYNKGNADLAVEYFLKSISLDPAAAESQEFTEFLEQQRFGWQILNRLGWAYFQQQDYHNSLRLFELSLNEQPERSEAHQGVGYNMFRLGKYKTAAAYLKRTLNLNPEPVAVTETLPYPTRGMEFTTRTSVRGKLARAYHELGLYAEAVALYQEALSRDPQRADTHEGMGWTLLKLNRLAESRAAFTRALRLDPLNPFADKGLTQVKQLVATKNLRENKALSVRQIVKKTRQEMVGPN